MLCAKAGRLQTWWKSKKRAYVGCIKSHKSLWNGWGNDLSTFINIYQLYTAGFSSYFFHRPYQAHVIFSRKKSGPHPCLPNPCQSYPKAKETPEAPNKHDKKSWKNGRLELFVWRLFQVAEFGRTDGTYFQFCTATRNQQLSGWLASLCLSVSFHFPAFTDGQDFIWRCFRKLNCYCNGPEPQWGEIYHLIYVNLSISI